MHEAPQEFPAPFRALLDDIRTAADRQAVPEALMLSQQAVAWARKAGEQECLDRAVTNRIGFELLLEDYSSSARELQTILMRSGRPRTRYQAAYALSLLYSHREHLDRSLFYAKIARDAAELIADDGCRVAAFNRLGNVLTLQCYFDEALGYYDLAAPLESADAARQQALLTANIAYCLVMLGRFSDAMPKLVGARRLFRRIGDPDFEGRSGFRLTLCYAYIELGRPRHARRHGLTALAQGESIDDTVLISKALYLLGEVEKKAGNNGRAFGHFERLQSDFFPHQHELADLLMSVESHRLVNLRA